jgi:acylphosphatase
MPSEAAEARSAKITGRVQGVGFRWSAREAAIRLSLRGWVRNAVDGSVEVHFEGTPSAVERFSEWLRRGPPGARVDSALIRSVPPTGAYRSFTIEA